MTQRSSVHREPAAARARDDEGWSAVGVWQGRSTAHRLHFDVPYRTARAPSSLVRNTGISCTVSLIERPADGSETLAARVSFLPDGGVPHYAALCFSSCAINVLLNAGR